MFYKSTVVQYLTSSQRGYLWPGSEQVSLTDQVRGFHLVILAIACTALEVLSSKITFLRAKQSEPWRGEIHQGNRGVLDIGHWPQTQQLD